MCIYFPMRRWGAIFSFFHPCTKSYIFSYRSLPFDFIVSFDLYPTRFNVGKRVVKRLRCHLDSRTIDFNGKKSHNFFYNTPSFSF